MKHIRYYKQEGHYQEHKQVIDERNTNYVSTTPDIQILEEMFIQHNMPNRPMGKDITSMSVGDIVSIDGRAYQCAVMGWARL